MVRAPEGKSFHVEGLSEPLPHWLYTDDQPPTPWLATPDAVLMGMRSSQKELAAAGASVDIAAALPSAAVPAATAAAAAAGGGSVRGGGGPNPFGLSSAHSVDGYALVNAISAPSRLSVVSNITELLTRPPATAAAGMPESGT
ncbi:hypothetical protein ABBQ38_010758 [Trebouxia sp. C0009 RCD-2024]